MKELQEVINVAVVQRKRLKLIKFLSNCVVSVNTFRPQMKSTHIFHIICTIFDKSKGVYSLTVGS